MKNNKNIVNLDNLINKAYEQKYALLHINSNNLEWTKTILLAAQETNSPIIVATTETSLKYMGGINVFVNMLKALVNDLNITIPVVIHLDHGSYDCCIKCLKAGFTSVMFDGSKLPFEQNFKKTKNLVTLAKKHKASLEVEVGSIGGKEDGIASVGGLANLQECLQISKSGITCLAAGIGNIHGIYPEDWKGLDFKLLSKISQQTKIPLVLHGGSGVDNKQVKKAISLGVSKLNVNTELMIAFSDTLRKFYNDVDFKDAKNKYYDIRISFKKPIEEMKKVIIDKLKLSGSFNKA